jgi:hypothetical protein
MINRRMILKEEAQYYFQISADFCLQAFRNKEQIITIRTDNNPSEISSGCFRTRDSDVLFSGRGDHFEKYPNSMEGGKR